MNEMEHKARETRRFDMSSDYGAVVRLSIKVVRLSKTPVNFFRVIQTLR